MSDDTRETRNPNPAYMGFAERLKKAREAAGFKKQSDFAAVIGVTSQSVSLWEAAITMPKPARLKRVAQALGLSFTELADGTAPISRPSMAALVEGLKTVAAWSDLAELSPAEYVAVPRIRVELAAGNGRLVDMVESEKPLVFQVEWFQKMRVRPERMRVMKVVGDSMEPYLFDRDVVAINLESRMLKEGKAFAIRYGHELRVKYLRRRYDGGLILHSLNSEKYPDEEISPTDLEHIEIIGEVVWRAG